MVLFAAVSLGKSDKTVITKESKKDQTRGPGEVQERSRSCPGESELAKQIPTRSSREDSHSEIFSKNPPGAGVGALSTDPRSLEFISFFVWGGPG